ncbi:hypothetical protein [Bosea sp. (in: a-proteobacteria)]|uniref:hypothetical protein n=1 Tax=Bosea sp. (in: a-proteobacteria) TaxID=1871050 RepID=UPI0025C56B08|nr:hypothetical protein [Bosea sp. (in: a-proteobacteria)]
MTDIPETLRDLALSTIRVPVIDELAGIEGLLPDIADDQERHAALLERLPSLLDLRGRALVHGLQYQRLLTLAEADPSALEDRVDTANALAILAHAGEIAMLLVPAGSAEDRFAWAVLSGERTAQYQAGSGVHDPALMTRALWQTVPTGGCGRVVGSRVPMGMEEEARRFDGTVLPERVESDPGPGIYHLEDALSLEAWFGAPPDLRGLLEEAKGHFAAMAAWSEPQEPGPFWIGATRGAHILAYAQLCRVGLWPARSADDLMAKQEAEQLIAERSDDPDGMRALVEIALGVGRRIAAQGAPFVTSSGGVEL